MPIYIDLCKVKVIREIFFDEDDDALIPLSDVRKALLMVPVENVAPRAEVELYKRQVNELEDELATTYDKLENAKAEVAREIFEEIEKHGRKVQSSDWNGEFWDVGILMRDIAELKKKYTEEKP